MRPGADSIIILRLKCGIVPVRYLTSTQGCATRPALFCDTETVHAARTDAGWNQDKQPVLIQRATQAKGMSHTVFI